MRSEPGEGPELSEELKRLVTATGPNPLPR
jgi:hypothetical protein